MKKAFLDGQKLQNVVWDILQNFGQTALVTEISLIAFCFLLISFAHQNVEIRNYISIDNNVKFAVIPCIDLRQTYLQMIGYIK